MASRAPWQRRARACRLALGLAAALLREYLVAATLDVKAPDPRAYHVQLPAFEGPLDLLLHLIQSHELDILDIPIRFITTKYLEYLSLLQNLAIDVASEYLVMAAVLAHIKSKSLLPHEPSDQADALDVDEVDPREELVRRLLEYQKYKHAASELAQLSSAAHDAFTRAATPEAAPAPGPAPLAPVPVFQLLDAFSKLLDRRKIKIDHEVTFDRLSITDRINELVDVLRRKPRVPFDALFDGPVSRFDLVITFLALLEMTRLRMTHIYQTSPLAPIYIEYRVAESEGDVAELDVEPLPEAAARDGAADDEPQGAGELPASEAT